MLERTDSLTWLSLRNAPEVHIVAVDQLNTYDVLASDDVVFTQGAYEAFVGKARADAPAAKATFVKAPAADEVVEDARSPRRRRPPRRPPPRRPRTPKKDADKVELPQGAKAPLKSGGAPKGYEIKGNAGSGKYHEPDGQWYDQTDAEFYFKTAEDAEAAGFERAGGGSAGEDDK